MTAKMPASTTSAVSAPATRLRVRFLRAIGSSYGTRQPLPYGRGSDWSCGGSSRAATVRERFSWPPSSQHLLMQHDVGPLAYLAKPDIHLLVGAIADELALNLVAIVFQRYRLPRMGGLRRGLHRLGKILFHVLRGQLHARLKTHLDEEQQRALPQQ